MSQGLTCDTRDLPSEGFRQSSLRNPTRNRFRADRNPARRTFSLWSRGDPGAGQPSKQAPSNVWSVTVWPALKSSTMDTPDGAALSTLLITVCAEDRLVRIAGPVAGLLREHPFVVDRLQRLHRFQQSGAVLGVVTVDPLLERGLQRVRPGPAGGVAVAGLLDLAERVTHRLVARRVGAERTPVAGLEVQRLQRRRRRGLQQGRVPRRAEADELALEALRRRLTDDDRRLRRARAEDAPCPASA